MITNIKSFAFILFTSLICFSSCEKESYSFGDIITPTGATLTAVVAGVDASNPNGNGSGTVAITTSASNAITYKIDFGDGKGAQLVPTGTINYKYTNPGTAEYVISVNAIGTAGATTTTSKKIKVFVAFEIPAAILQALTGGSSKIWITDKGAPGHFGVGPSDAFSPIWYAATPDSREACAYDDEITFSKDANNNVSLAINSKGDFFSTGFATAFYGFSGADGCYAISSGGTKKLAFSNASSGSTAAVSTMIQFEVPGNGIINFGTGGKVYEILTISATQVHIRNIGVDGNSWYQKLKNK